MSKSLNNYVGLKEDALSMYSKLEKTPDSLLQNYFELLTDLSLSDIPENPREAQKNVGGGNCGSISRQGVGFSGSKKRQWTW